MPNNPSKKKPTRSFVNHQYYTRRRRFEENDRLRETEEPPFAGFIPRRSNRDTLRDRRDSTVLPMSKTPLYGIDEASETNLASNSNPQSHNEMQNFATGAGEAHGNITPAPGQSRVGSPIPKGINRQTGGIPKNRAHIQSNDLIQGPTNNPPTGLDQNTMSLVKDMMTDMMAQMTATFKETLQLEAVKIARQVGNSSNQSLPSKPTPQAGDQSSYRLDYREPQNHQNEARSGTNQFTFQRPSFSSQSRQSNYGFAPQPNNHAPP